MAGLVEIRLARKSHPEHDPELTFMLADVLAEGVEPWNAWRRDNPGSYIDLRGVNITELIGIDGDLRGIDLSDANLTGANLSRLDLGGADLSAAYSVHGMFDGTHFDRAILRGAYFSGCQFPLATFCGADLRAAALDSCWFLLGAFTNANLRGASLKSAGLTDCSFDRAIMVEARLADAVLRDCSLAGARLERAELTGASFVECDLTGAVLDGARVFGASVWKCVLAGASQRDLLITDDKPDLTVDDLRVAQFLYLILNNSEIRHVIDTITSKVVLILGRFSAEQKPKLQRIKDRLRDLNYSPVIFDFERPLAKNYIETVATLANMARFVIADFTDAKVVLQEVDNIVRNCPSTPVAAIYQAGDELPCSILDFASYRTFLAPVSYPSIEVLVHSLETMVVAPAERLAAEIIRDRERFAARHAPNPARGGDVSDRQEEWLPGTDSNHRPTG